MPQAVWGNPPDRAVRGTLLVLIMGAAVLLYAQFFSAFAVPYPDFFQYWEDALAYLQGTVPMASKRLPLFPLMIGELSRLLPGPHAIMLAAQLLNLALAPVCLWLIDRIARTFVQPSTSLAVVALCAVNSTLYYAAVEPNLEMTILASVLLVIHLAQRGSGWAYAAAFLAGLTRHDILPLIPVLVLQDVALRRRSQYRSVVWGALAGSGFLAWTVLNLWHTTLLGHPYVAGLLARDGHPLEFLGGSLRVMADFLPAWLVQFDVARRTIWLIQFGLLAAGFRVLAHRHGARAMLLIGFFLAYSVVHTAFPSYLPRYTMPVLWIAYLAMAAALEAGAERARVFRARPVLAAAALLLCAMAASGIASSVRFMRSYYVLTNRATFRQAGEWYRTSARPGDTLVTTLPRIIRYYSGLPDASVVWSASLASSSPEALLDELRARGVTYLLWDNKYGYDTSYDAGRYKARLLTELTERFPGALEPVRRFRVGREEAVVYRVRP